MSINNIVKTLGTALLLGVLMSSLPSCQKQEGPVERAGKEVDKAVDKVGQQIEKAGDAVQDAAKDAKK